MSLSSIKSWSVTCTATALASLISIWILCGGDWALLTDSSDIRWLVMGDRAFGFLGWLDYLRHEWTIPLSTTAHYLYPAPMNLALSDSTPLLAFLAKAIGPSQFSIWHPYGYWLITCFFLQALFASLLAQRFLASNSLLRFAFTLIVAIAPPLYWRNGHLALMAHWVLLAAFYLATTQKETPFWPTYLAWLLLAIIAALIHPYWPPMVLVIAGCVFFHDGYTRTRIPRTQTVGSAIVHFVGKTGGLLTMSLIGFWMLGILGQPKPRDKIYQHTADILMPFNSYAWGTFVPAIFKFRSGQYEGFSYIGAGMMMLLFIFLFRKKILNQYDYPFRRFVNPRAELTGLCIGCFFLYLWSLGAKIRLFGFTMGYLDFIYQPLQPVLGAFRSAGRFAWGVHYLIVLLLFIWLAHLWTAGKKKSAMAMAFIALILQFTETAKKAGTFFVRDQNFSSLNSQEWRSVLTGKKTIAMIPPYIPYAPCATPDEPPGRWIPLALIAVENGLQINSGDRANPPKDLGVNYCKKLDDDLQSGRFDPEVAYVVPPWADQSSIAHFKNSGSLECHRLSAGYTVCI